MDLGFQDVLATLTAMSAVVIIVRRIVGAVKPTANPGCANCPMVRDSSLSPLKRVL